MPDPIASFDEQAIKPDNCELVRQTVEDATNALLDEKADLPVNAGRCERTADREAHRAAVLSRILRTLNDRPVRFGTVARPAATRPGASSIPIGCLPRTRAWPSPA